ncbi:MAG: CpcT/CpeT family chromophore lyase [Acidobacteriota bacterium]
MIRTRPLAALLLLITLVAVPALAADSTLDELATHMTGVFTSAEQAKADPEAFRDVRLVMVPIFFPLVISLDLGMPPEQIAIWFGIVVVVVTEISLITPPVGLNVFVLKGVVGNVTTATIFRGVTPFWIVDLIRLALLVLIPSLVLFLPNSM